MRDGPAQPPFSVAALYRFASIGDPVQRQTELQSLCAEHAITGTLLIAHEGINGTIAGTKIGLDAVVGAIRTWPGFDTLEVKWSGASENPFIRLKVRLKSEIVTMGVPDLDPAANRGTYVAPADWNALIADPDVVVIDTRNDYEVALGTFEGAVDPATPTFRDFPAWADVNLDPARDTKVAMFCTGGIRCEKATALLKARGFENVFHLQGGILKYLEEVPEDESRWRGECFVFDRRVSVVEGLEEGTHTLCAVCRNPFQFEGAQGGFAPEPCPACRAAASPNQKARAAERQRQIAIAKARGHAHLGPDAAASQSDNDGD
ncbi:MAG: rhodanese-related sulfurtransferase [Pseudomonadota bacterium]